MLNSKKLHSFLTISWCSSKPGNAISAERNTKRHMSASVRPSWTNKLDRAWKCSTNIERLLNIMKKKDPIWRSSSAWTWSTNGKKFSRLSKGTPTLWPKYKNKLFSKSIQLLPCKNLSMRLNLKMKQMNKDLRTIEWKWSKRRKIVNKKRTGTQTKTHKLQLKEHIAREARPNNRWDRENCLEWAMTHLSENLLPSKKTKWSNNLFMNN